MLQKETMKRNSIKSVESEKIKIEYIEFIKARKDITTVTYHWKFKKLFKTIYYNFLVLLNKAYGKIIHHEFKFKFNFWLKYCNWFNSKFNTPSKNLDELKDVIENSISKYRR